jgi:2-polyprenyl-3-methyl-5-hydroxy-6-metoxy-1,4-benzoquinol methylase
MDTRTIIDRKNEVIAKYGDWTAHNLCLQDDVYTIAPEIVGDEIKLRRIVQCVFDLAGGSVEGLRVLDLACLEGLYAIEFARHRADCLGIEGREANIEKARFAKQVLQLDNLDLVRDDVRNLSAEKYGRFDVVLCLGLLYHLDAPDVFPFIERLSEVCRRICVVDTRIALSPTAQYSYRGRIYSGIKGNEHGPGDTSETKKAKLWASLDNCDNFWLSRATFYNALSHAGFTTVYECGVPAEPLKPADRITVVAIKGETCRLLSTPLMAARPEEDVPERPRRENSVAVDSLRKISALLPRRVREAAKTVVGRNNKLT